MVKLRDDPEREPGDFEVGDLVAHINPKRSYVLGVVSEIDDSVAQARIEGWKTWWNCHNLYRVDPA